MMLSKRNIMLAGMAVLLGLALVLPLTNGLANPFRFFTDNGNQEHQTNQPPSTVQTTEEIPTAKQNNNPAEAPPVNTGAATTNKQESPSSAPKEQPVPVSQTPQPVQTTPETGAAPQPVPKGEQGMMVQPESGHYKGADCAPVAPVPSDYQPNYEWYSKEEGWGNRSGHW
ncbi:MAG: hypothetical protein M0021_01485 [Clostridia bacterium]|nr:hypothetical protein [Clostridia bacterium]